MSLTHRIITITRKKHDDLQTQILSRIRLIHKMYEPIAKKLEDDQMDNLNDEDWRDVNSIYRGTLATLIKLTQINYTYLLLGECDKDKSIEKQLKYSNEEIKKFKDYFQHLHEEEITLKGESAPLMVKEIKTKFPLVSPEDFDDFLVSVMSDDALKPEGKLFKRLCVDLLSEAQQSYTDSINGWIRDFSTTKSLELLEDIYHTAKSQTSH